VAISPPSATFAAAASASRKASGRETWWSAGSIAMTPRGSRAATWSAARPTQGAVLRAHGSTMKFLAGSSGRSFRAAFAWAGPQTTKVCFALAKGGSRWTVAEMSGSSPARARNCFGRSRRDSGQKRVPEPPAMTIG
jgi:hypothetical protein